MVVQVFGAGPSGYNANTALRRCADDGIGRYDTDVITAVDRNFYVDDFITSVADVPTANLIRVANQPSAVRRRFQTS